MLPEIKEKLTENIHPSEIAASFTLLHGKSFMQPDYRKVDFIAWSFQAIKYAIKISSSESNCDFSNKSQYLLFYNSIQ